MSIADLFLTGNNLPYANTFQFKKKACQTDQKPNFVRQNIAMR